MANISRDDSVCLLCGDVAMPGTSCINVLIKHDWQAAVRVGRFMSDCHSRYQCQFCVNIHLQASVLWPPVWMQAAEGCESG